MRLVFHSPPALTRGSNTREERKILLRIKTCAKKCLLLYYIIVCGLVVGIFLDDTACTYAGILRVQVALSFITGGCFIFYYRFSIRILG
jgi:hypothetical protein